ncbi:ABC transporter permease [Halomonas halocynthiae]|uniref:ABC transporter permease n=1 Tax=Halomonas halocynthiae TaxID=176290 RepID=UPI00041946B4|nr:FtsX-like permease family protein [Halomonas halocynthiae]
MIAMVKLSLRGLWRDFRASDVRALLLALTLAVAAATMIGFFLDRLERGLTREAGQLLGGDLVLEQSRPFGEALRSELLDAGFTLSERVGMVSMVSQGEGFSPASLKAVDDAYPHYGESLVDRGEGNGAESLARGPAPGSVWIAPRLEILLDVGPGDMLQVGQAKLKIDGVIEREADPSAGFSSFNPRVMMHVADLPATGLVQPGSRINYALLAAGPVTALDAIEPRLVQWREQGLEIQDVHRDRPRLGSALARADRYLSLAGLAAVLLAGVAVAMATRRYVERHLDTAALLRSFGATQRQLGGIFMLQLLWLALLASLLGAVLGLAGQALLLLLLSGMLPVDLPAPGLLPLVMGVLTALAVLVGFAGPTLLRLRRVSALKVLRREFDPLPASAWLVQGSAAAVFGVLLWMYSGDIGLALGLLVGGSMALLGLWWLGSLLLKLLLGVCGALPRAAAGQNEVSGVKQAFLQALRIGGSQLARRREASLGQLLAFATTLFAMAMIAMVRGDLLSAWQEQLPADTPNYFAINIQPHEREGFEAQLDALALSRSSLYPMVRGRITAINGQLPRDVVPSEAQGNNALNRELNLTWSNELPDGNRVVAGDWSATAEPVIESLANGAEQGWHNSVDAVSSDSTPVAKISMEAELASNLGLALGDVLTFSIGSEQVHAEIASLRTLNWDSFQPNFYVIFPPKSLDGFGHSFITAFRMDTQREAVKSLITQFPSVTLLDVDAILQRVRDVLNQVTRAVEWVLIFVLLAGFSVLYAALTASAPVRAHEGGVLRVFGAGQATLARIQAAEFALLGLSSGLLAALLAELASAGLYMGWLDLAPRLHLWLWLWLPLSGALLVGGIGHWLSRDLRRQAPMASLGLIGET